jgi:beta-galactosidase
VAVPVHVFADELKKAAATSVIATWDRDFLKGTPAVTENRFGKGTAVYYASFFNLEAARQLIRRYAAVQNLKPLMTGVPKAVEVTRRTKNNINYYFVLNHAATPVAVKPGAGYFDVLAGAAAPGTFELGPFEYRVLRK